MQDNPSYDDDSRFPQFVAEHKPGPPATPLPTRSELDNLKLLSIFQFVYGGFLAIFAMFPLIYMGMGAAFVSGAFNNSGSAPPPPAVGWVFIGLGATLMIFGLAMAACIILTGVSLANGQRRLFCLIISFIECLNFPIGTLLGVFTAVTLFKPGVKAHFEAQKRVNISG